MQLEEIALPADWFHIKLNQQLGLYLNVKQQVASLAPVFELNKTEMILKDFLGQNIDFAMLQTQIQKIKKTINLAFCKIPLIDDQPNNQEAIYDGQVDLEHKQIKEQMIEKVRELELMIPTDEILGLDGIAGGGVQPDCASLLSQIAGQYFQCIPVCEDEVHEMTQNPKMRVMTMIKMNGQVVSKGFGPNKKASKLAAVNILLSLICPNIYKQFQEKKSKEALPGVMPDIANHQELLIDNKPLSPPTVIESASGYEDQNHDGVVQKYDQKDMERYTGYRRWARKPQKVATFEEISEMQNREFTQEQETSSIGNGANSSDVQGGPLKCEKVPQEAVKMHPTPVIMEAEKENANPDQEPQSELVRRRTSRKLTEDSIQKTWLKYQKSIQLEKERQEKIHAEQKELQEKKEKAKFMEKEKEEPNEMNLPEVQKDSDSPIEEKQVNPIDQADLSSFTAEQLERISEGKDAFIDDPEIMTSKRELLQGFTPLGTINVIQTKHKELQVVKKETFSKRDPTDATKMIFGFSVSLPDANPNTQIQGCGEESTKKCAQHAACQQFLKNLFPPGTTWNELVDIVQNQKDQLREIVGRGVEAAEDSNQGHEEKQKIQEGN